MSVFPTNTLITSVLNLIKTDTPYLALYTVSPTASGGGTEVTGGSYARLPITFGTITNGSMSNTSTVTFSNLPTVTSGFFAIHNAFTGGTMKVYGALNTAMVVVTGDQIQFPVGSIVINLSGS